MDMLEKVLDELASAGLTELHSRSEDEVTALLAPLLVSE
jgi:hypothetical protein